MTALAEVQKGLARKLAMRDCHRLNRNSGAPEENLRLAHPLRAELVFDDDRQFDVTCDADPADIGVVNELCEFHRLGLPVEDRDQGRGVEDHFGRPFSS